MPRVELRADTTVVSAALKAISGPPAPNVDPQSLRVPFAPSQLHLPDCILDWPKREEFPQYQNEIIKLAVALPWYTTMILSMLKDQLAHLRMLPKAIRDISNAHARKEGLPLPDFIRAVRRRLVWHFWTEAFMNADWTGNWVIA